MLVITDYVLLYAVFPSSFHTSPDDCSNLIVCLTLNPFRFKSLFIGRKTETFYAFYLNHYKENTRIFIKNFGKELKINTNDICNSIIDI